MADSSQDSPVNRQFDAGGDNAAASTSSATPPPQDDDPVVQQEQREKALSFVKLVRDTIKDTSKFRNFHHVILDFKHNRISEAELCKRVKEMLKDYPILLPGLSAFLPPTPTDPTGPTQDDLTPEPKMTQKEAHSSSTTTDEPPPPPPPPQDDDPAVQQEQREKALSFVKSVRDTIKDPPKYRNFLHIILDFKHNRISEAELCKRVKEMLKDYPIDLLPCLSAFPPPTPTGPTPTQTQTQTQDDLTPEPKMTKEDAHRFLEKVKIRLQNNKQNYQAFLQLLKDFSRSQISSSEAINGVFYLFAGYDDLIEECRNFFPSDDSNNRT